MSLFFLCVGTPSYFYYHFPKFRLDCKSLEFFLFRVGNFGVAVPSWSFWNHFLKGSHIPNDGAALKRSS